MAWILHVLTPLSCAHRFSCIHPPSRLFEAIFHLYCASARTPCSPTRCAPSCHSCTHPVCCHSCHFNHSFHSVSPSHLYCASASMRVQPSKVCPKLPLTPPSSVLLFISFHLITSYSLSPAHLYCASARMRCSPATWAPSCHSSAHTRACTRGKKSVDRRASACGE